VKSVTGDIYAGGLVGYATTRSITNSAALGASVTAASSDTKNIGRVFGDTTTSNKSNNRAYDGMTLYSDVYAKKDNPDLVTTFTPSTFAHDNRYGADASYNDFHYSNVWRNAPPASGAPSTFHGLGFLDANWIFTTVGYYGYPILKGVGGAGVLGGQ
jgi:hypothetical protein